MKKYVTKAICIIIPAIAIDLFYRPLPIIPSHNDAQILRVSHNWKNVTNEVDIEKIIEILSGYYMRRTFNNQYNRLVADEIWDMRLRRRSEFLNVSLGTNFVIYDGGNRRFSYRILDPETLLHELEAVFN